MGRPRRPPKLPPKPAFVERPPNVRTRELIELFVKHGQIGKAHNLEREYVGRFGGPSGVDIPQATEATAS